MKSKIIYPAIVGSFLILFFLSCSKSDSGSNPTPLQGTTIDIINMAFPASTTVKVGTKVNWVNKDSFAHTVTSDDGTTFNSGTLAGGATFSFTPTVAGSFAYHCNIHSNMHGTLIVTP